MTDDDGTLAPAFYGSPQGSGRGPWADWWLLLHPPYTLWHLSYVAIGAGIAPHFDGGRLAGTLVAFLLAVGVGAHALDELHGRPLHTAIPRRILIGAAAASLAIAVGIGIVGTERVGVGLVVFIVVGVALNCSYNLELFGGRFHNDLTFALAWGAFPVLTGYYAQAESLRSPVVAAAVAAYFLSTAQRSLSTPARALRRRTASVNGILTADDGRSVPLTRSLLLQPLEAALKAMAWGMVALAAALVLYRCLDA